MTKKDIRIGSVLRDLNGEDLTVVKFDGAWTIAKYDVNGAGEIWLVDSHLEGYELVTY